MRMPANVGVGAQYVGRLATETGMTSRVRITFSQVCRDSDPRRHAVGLYAFRRPGSFQTVHFLPSDPWTVRARLFFPGGGRPHSDYPLQQKALPDPLQNYA